ncbi:polyadenylate-binding protein 2 [Phtheirospermum japonicum]|uniref:Polyadenylate-binding protein 2 n=1 Tax=Phtheirospermum japonicum TaxID=374723 RepID=A0A830BU80_9LAMI|nr:polyadenylate-binding protein 2 [Phtheirospermum japonicum]
MEEEEHEVYGGEIPDEGEMEADVDMPAAEDEAAAKELDEMKKRLKEMEEEAAALREMQAKVEKEMGAVQDPASAAAAAANKEEVDSRSVFVGNFDDADVAGSFGAHQIWLVIEPDVVDYACTPEEVQQHFQACGTVNRVTILTDKFGQPKGFAYVEFIEQEAVQEALQLNESELHGRQLKVMVKRTNVPGMKQFRGRRFNPFLAYGRRPYVPPYFYSPYGSKVPASEPLHALLLNDRCALSPFYEKAIIVVVARLDADGLSVIYLVDEDHADHNWVIHLLASLLVNLMCNELKMIEDLFLLGMHSGTLIAYCINFF